MTLGGFLTPLNLNVLGCKMGIITASTSQLYEKLNRQSAKFRVCCFVIILYRNNTDVVSTEVALSCRRGDRQTQRKAVSKLLVEAKQRGLCVFLSFSQRDTWVTPWETGMRSRGVRGPRRKPPSLTNSSPTFQR